MDLLFNCIIYKYFCYLGNYILNYLATRPKLPAFVVQALVLLFAKITKQGWFDGEKDSYAFRNVVTDISVFLQVSNFTYFIILGYRLLSKKFHT